MKVIVFYGTDCNDKTDWIPWLKQQLSNQGIDCIIPNLPTPENQTYKVWANITKDINICEDDIVVSWSTGAIFSVRYLYENKIKVDKLFLISGFNNYVGNVPFVDNINKNFFMQNLKHARSIAKEIVCIKSDDDPFITQEALNNFAKELNAKTINIVNGGHFNNNAGYNEFPQLLSQIRNERFLTNVLKRAKELSVNIDSIFVEEKNKLEKRIINDIDLHQLRSCSKILIAMAYGIALQEKYICKITNELLTLDTKIYPTLSTIYKDKIDDKVKEWTIKTLLTFTTGYDEMLISAKQLKDIDKSKALELIMQTRIKNNVGEKFVYNNVEPYILSLFFQENFGMNIADFINERIFKPLGIKNYTWSNYGKYCAGATGLYINHNDFHKIGKLLMNNGIYENKQVIPTSWIKEMIKPQIKCPNYYKPERVLPKLNAGYYTWISRNNIVFRDGSDGQYIICDFNNNRLITIMATEKEMSKVSECLRNLI